MKNLHSNDTNNGTNLLTVKENEIFFFRLKGDLFKYLSQVESKDEEEKLLTQAEFYFKESAELANKNLDMYNIISLSTMIAYGKFLTHFVKKEEEAMIILNNILKQTKSREILDGTVPAETELFNYLSDIKNIINNINSNKK